MSVQIWRSGLLALSLLSLSGICSIPIAFAFSLQSEQRNFRLVTEGRFFRSGQMSLSGLSRAIHNHKIRSVITFRGSYDLDKGNPDANEEAWCNQEGIRYLRLMPLHWHSEGQGEPPILANLHKYFNFLANEENYPILIHCFAGIHRTGAYCALYRMEVEDWPCSRALHEMRTCGYSSIDQDIDISRFLADYKVGGHHSKLTRKKLGSSPLFSFGN